MNTDEFAEVLKQIQSGWLAACQCIADRLDNIDKNVLALSKSINRHVKAVNRIAEAVRDDLHDEDSGNADWWKGGQND